MSDDDTIPLIGAHDVDVDVRDNDVRGGGDAPRIPIDRLREQIAKMARIVTGPELDDLPTRGGFGIEEIKLTAEISAKGELGFLVAGMEAEAKGSVEITFKRRS